MLTYAWRKLAISAYSQVKTSVGGSDVEPKDHSTISINFLYMVSLYIMIRTRFRSFLTAKTCFFVFLNLMFFKPIDHLRYFRGGKESSKIAYLPTFS